MPMPMRETIKLRENYSNEMVLQNTQTVYKLIWCDEEGKEEKKCKIKIKSY